MSAHRSTGLWIVGFLGVAAVAGGLVFVTGSKGSRTPKAEITFDESTPLSALTQPLRESDARALAALFQKSIIKPDAKPTLMTDAEGAEWVEVIKALRTGFPKFGSYGRTAALSTLGRVFQRFVVEDSPSCWSEMLAPAHDLLNSGLADENLDVRVTSLMEIGRLWSWVPGSKMLPVEEYNVSIWKDGFSGPVVRRLADREPKARGTAVACLGYNPVTAVATEAIAYLDDPASSDVRKQVMVSFASRRSILSEDAILKMMYDKDPSIPPVAELILKTRGLTQEQISLGSMIFHPKPEIRASLIPLLKERSDVDPTTWLIQLSRDIDESVRMSAVDALAARQSPEIGKRLAEMATTDKSAEVRRAVSKHILPGSEKTAALPPLPGSSSLNPKAN